MPGRILPRSRSVSGTDSAQAVCRWDAGVETAEDRRFGEGIPEADAEEGNDSEGDSEEGRDAEEGDVDEEDSDAEGQ